jgi:hypothetical protein
MIENISSPSDQDDFDRRWKEAEEQLISEMKPDEVYKFISGSGENSTDFQAIEGAGPSVMGFLKWLAAPVSNFLRKRKQDS